MKLSNVKLIFLREVRDQLRDRRTLFMIFVLPLFNWASRNRNNKQGYRMYHFSLGFV